MCLSWAVKVEGGSATPTGADVSRPCRMIGAAPIHTNAPMCTILLPLLARMHHGATFDMSRPV